jgi:hypothetical protein
MSQLLPQLPHLDHLKKQAKGVLRVVERQKPGWKLTDAQHAIARGYGFSSWPDLKRHVESVRRRPDRAVAAQLRSREPALNDTAIAPLPDADVGPRDRHHERPIMGTWIANPARSTRPVSEHQHEGLMLEFELTGDTITLTQVSTDASGLDVAVKMAIHADGREYPVPYGNGLVMQARWANPRVLEAVVKNREHVLSQGTYEVSPDGLSLTFSTPGQSVVFDRA